MAVASLALRASMPAYEQRRDEEDDGCVAGAAGSLARA
jgi:hypothetical protein